LVIKKILADTVIGMQDLGARNNVLEEHIAQYLNKTTEKNNQQDWDQICACLANS
jgi:hypothetical protein